MAELRHSLGVLGYQNLQTYIQSGNLLFESSKDDVRVLEKEIKANILQDFAFDVPVLVRTVSQLEMILHRNPFLGKAENNNLYFVLLHTRPVQSNVNGFNQLQFENEDFHVTGDCVYLNCYAGYGKAKLSNNLIEKKLGVTATARNLKTMTKMLELAKGL